MEETYEDIVRKWYVKLRDNFTHILMEKYKHANLRLADAENIYQDIFIAIHKNIEEGRIGMNCDWRNYIIRVGLNMASKGYRKFRKLDYIDEEDQDDKDRLSAKAHRISELLSDLPVTDGEGTVYDDPEAHALLGDELTHTPEPCASIIRLAYFSEMSDKEIAGLVAPYCENGKTLADNAKAVKARRWLCMRNLIYRVKSALYSAGIIDVKPVKEKRNGK